MGDTSETNTKVLYRELFLGVVALKTPIPQNHYLRDKVPFLKSGHIFFPLLKTPYYRSPKYEVSSPIEHSGWGVSVQPTTSWPPHVPSGVTYGGPANPQGR